MGCLWYFVILVLQISKGSYPDVIELDAASNNSVENIRYINDKIALSLQVEVKLNYT